jgi:hypothetical protein
MNKNNVNFLEKGKPIDRTINCKDVHCYHINLLKDQFISINAIQNNINIIIALFGPENDCLITVNYPEVTYGPVSLLWISGSEGVYRIEIRSTKDNCLPGN